MQDDNIAAKKFIDSAKLYFTENSNIDIAFSYYLITAQVFKKMNVLDSSFYYFKICFDQSIKYNYSFGKAESQVQMGAIAILQKSMLMPSDIYQQE